MFILMLIYWIIKICIYVIEMILYFNLFVWVLSLCVCVKFKIYIIKWFKFFKIDDFWLINNVRKCY